MGLRDHQPLILDTFKGLWQRGGPDSVPLDHFQDCSNVRFNGENVETRYGVGVSQDVLVPLKNIKRVYNYPTQTANTLIILVENDLGEGEIYHYVNPTTLYGPLLTIPTMTDFAFVPYAGRGYISPFTTFVTGDINIQKGISGEFVYVYAGDGTAARKAAGVGLSGALTIANGAAGHTDAGLHVFGFVSETVSGYLCPPAALGTFSTLAGSSVSFGTIPTSGDANVTKRHLVASKVITNYNGDPSGYDLYFVPNATINDNVTVALNNISFYDLDLIDDASHLFDNFTEIPAGAVLSIYHNRLLVGATFNDISIYLVSTAGEPEAISQIDGLIIVPLDGNPVTNAQEIRDILYAFKRSRTVAYIDNGDVPSSWPMTVIDNALGTCVHGIATVLDSGSTSIDYLIIAAYAGIYLFNGRYITPELTWKIQDLWLAQNRNLFREIQIIYAPIQKEVYCILPDGRLLVGNFGVGLDPKNIRWSLQQLLVKINTIAIWNIDTIIIGSPITTELM